MTFSKSPSSFVRCTHTDHSVSNCTLYIYIYMCKNWQFCAFPLHSLWKLGPEQQFAWKLRERSHRYTYQERLHTCKSLHHAAPIPASNPPNLFDCPALCKRTTSASYNSIMYLGVWILVYVRLTRGVVLALLEQSPTQNQWEHANNFPEFDGIISVEIL